ncbi:alpha/beta hydrolase fold domain-containing protein [Halomonas sp. YLGW01]|uniref:alpha/beta hydrolase fold domain-containing protein n=1 Tax=Halomonas sp. YLGW01 TaxID=2773308 RepID=UPI00177BE7BC|nr:alpha/beta hydrolase fold domain-containing protein [Halomonas sp. YLGW01]
MSLSPITCHDFIEEFAQGMAKLEGLSVAESRPHCEALYARLAAPIADGVAVRDDNLCSDDGHTIPLRRFTPQPDESRKDGRVVYLHGGSWQVGSLDSHQGVASSLASQLRREVVSVDYRLLPEASYQQALMDCDAAVRKLAPVAVVGDSAGGRLVMDVSRRHRKEFKAEALHDEAPAPYVLGLIYPPMDPVLSLAADDFTTLGPTAPLLSREEIVAMWQLVAEGDPSRSHAITPAHSRQAPAESIEVLSVEHDPLTSPLEAAVATWRRQDADVGYHCSPGMVHAALHAHHELPEMQQAWQAFCTGLRGHLA